VFRRSVVAVPHVLALLGFASIACTPVPDDPESSVAGNRPVCASGVDCGGSSGESSSGATSPDGGPGGGGINGIKDGAETDVDCGGPSAPKCGEGKSCLVDGDCDVACSYKNTCIPIPSCKPHLGGDTCGEGEVEGDNSAHESCCRSLPVTGYVDPAHAGKQVYLDKYEITAGRIRAWIEAITAMYDGAPDVKRWVAEHRPAIWDEAWDEFLPTDWYGPVKVINRRLLGDPRPEDNGWTGPPGPGVILPPPTDQPRRFGVDYQFNAEMYVDLHGMSCGVWEGTYGFPTYYYPASVLERDGQLARADGSGFSGQRIPAKDLLDVKAMNCITNAMLAAFCAWDGGQLATDEVLDHVTATPASLGNVSGCGTQYDNHGELLKNIFDHTVQTGGRCANVALVNATFDAGDALPVPNSPLNVHNYYYPDLGGATHDKAWQISAPGRGSLAMGAGGAAVDAVRLKAGDEPWMDLHGNLNEAALDMSGASFTGTFALKYRGIGYGSSRSDLNVDEIKFETIRRIQRPEAKAAYIGGRCMRFR
jgi:hypothetical protein